MIENRRAALAGAAPLRSPGIVGSSKAAITCPHCGAMADAEVPEGACLFFWDCLSCQRTVRPRAGDCCVFCSYGSRPCPSALERIPHP